MPYIKINKTKEHISYLTETMTIYEARKELKWILKQKCINCNEQCADCYLIYKDKIAIEKVLEYLNKNKITIKGYKTIKK